MDTICANFLTRGFLKEAAKVEIAHAEKEKQAAMEAEEEQHKSLYCTNNVILYNFGIWLRNEFERDQKIYYRIGSIHFASRISDIDVSSFPECFCDWRVGRKYHRIS